MKRGKTGLLGRGQWRRLLGGVRVRATLVHFELGHQDAAQAVLGHHPAHGVGDELLGVAGADLLGPSGNARRPSSPSRS